MAHWCLELLGPSNQEPSASFDFIEGLLVTFYFNSETGKVHGYLVMI